MKRILLSIVLALTAQTIKAQTVVIGTQTWTTKNLDVATYSDGTPIPQVTEPTAWANLITGAWCYYNNDSANGTNYGKLYNWYAVAGIWNEASKTDASQRKKLAPTGYHIPSEAEWTTLTTYLGDGSQGIPSSDEVVFNKMAEKGSSHWTGIGLTATNSTGFTALPGGYRENSNGIDYYLGSTAKFSSTSFFSFNGTLDKNNIFICTLGNSFGTGVNYNTSGGIRDGFSVRCLRDSSLSNTTFDTSSLKLYPNPVLSILNIDNNLTNQPYKIVDTLGKVILKGKLNEGDNSINVEQLSKGIYYIKLANNKASKFIKE